MPDNALKLGLNRPEYLANPDLLLVALAGRCFSMQVPAGEALVYRNIRPQTSGGTLHYRETSPLANREEKLSEWTETLEDCGILTYDRDLSDVARALAASMVSSGAERSLSVNALPITAHTSLLQQPSGMMRKKGPPNFALILEQLYALGAPEASSVSGLWNTAVTRRLEIDPLAQSVDAAVARSLLAGLEVNRSEPGWEVGQRLDQLQFGPLSTSILNWTKELKGNRTFGTPMVWFERNWGRITSTAWVEALPARRWVDWASTVLRHALAFGFLWEARFFGQLSALVLSPDALITEDSLRDCLNSSSGLLSWRDSDLDRGSRAVSLKQDVIRGLRAMRFFEAYESSDGDDPIATLNEIRRNPEYRQNLKTQFADRQKFPRDENMWEAIRYALLIRNEVGVLADHYGLLRANHSWLYPDPGAEWVVVMASLCAGPDGYTTAGALLSELNLLGIDVSLPELLRLVEASGLADLAADADDAVIIESAF